MGKNLVHGSQWNFFLGNRITGGILTGGGERYKGGLVLRSTQKVMNPIGGVEIV